MTRPIPATARPPDTRIPAIDSARFRGAMARFPSGVTITTTLDEKGCPRGFTASSLVSVSLDPPLISVCVAYSANCYPAFAGCSWFAVSVLRHDHGPLAHVFASKGIDKFVHGQFTRTATGIPVVDNALVTLECEVFGRHSAGDHVIIVGRVHELRVVEGSQLLIADQQFSRLQR